jgi:signal transduction histidine kinase
VVIATVVRAVPLGFFHFGSGALSHLDAWKGWFFTSLVVQTLTLISAYWLIFPGDPTNQLYFIVLFVGVASGGALVLSAHLPTAAMFVATLLSPMAIRFMFDDDFPFLFGLLTFVYGGLLVNAVRDNSNFIKESITLHRENEIAIRDLKKSEQELLIAKEFSERSNRAKSDFLANMSHELRTPLNAILGFSDVIRRQAFGPGRIEKYQEYASDIHHAGGHLLDLINDVLDLSKIEADQMYLDEREVDLNAAVTSMVHMVSDRAFQKTLDLDVNLESNSPTIFGDERAVKQIAGNLLSNAVKFTPEGGSVFVVSKIEPDGGVMMQIRDTGIGIKKTDIQKVLEPFGQVTSAYNRETEGTGLGLPLSKRLVELQGGKLTIESEFGVGTNVTVRFPSRSSLD